MVVASQVDFRGAGFTVDVESGDQAGVGVVQFPERGFLVHIIWQCSCEIRTRQVVRAAIEEPFWSVLCQQSWGHDDRTEKRSDYGVGLHR